MKKIIFKNPNYWNKAEGVDIVNEILVDMDKEGVEIEALVVKEQGVWTEDLEHMASSFVYDAKELTKVETKGKATFVTDSLSFPGKEVLTHLKDGHLIIVSHEVVDLLDFLEERYGYLKEFQEFSAKTEKLEKKVKDFRDTRPKKADFEETEDFETAKQSYDMKLNNKKDKVEKNKRVVSSLREKLGISGFNAKYLMSEGLYLFKSVKPVYINKEAGVLILEIDKRSSFTYRDFDYWTEMAYDSKHEKKKDAKNMLIEHMNPFTFEYKVKVPVMVGYMDPIKNEVALEVEFNGTISMAGSTPAAPVKPSIAAAMLASGAGGKLDKSIIIDSEDCLIKTAITPVQTTETIEVNGNEQVVRTFSWEPQLGLFNKLKKEFQILT